MDDIEILAPEFSKGVRLESRKGNRIPTLRRDPMIPEILKAANQTHRDSFPNIETRSLDSSYNCAGMVFAFRRAWIEPKHIPRLLEEDEYLEVKRDNTIPGDLIVYYDSNDRNVVRHVGIIIEKSRNIEAADWVLRVISQWGREGEYLHCETDVPFIYCSTRVYYSEKKCDLLNKRK